MYLYVYMYIYIYRCMYIYIYSTIQNTLMFVFVSMSQVSICWHILCADFGHILCADFGYVLCADLCDSYVQDLDCLLCAI